MIYINAANEIIENNDPVTVGDINYPRNYPKGSIPGLTLVTETAQPDAVVTGFTVVDGVQVWQSTAYTLAALKATKTAEATATHNTKLGAGFNYGGKNYQTDLKSMGTVNNFMTGLLAGASNPHNGYYRATDNTRATMNDAELAVFLNAIGVYYGALRGNLHDLKDDIEAAANQTALDAIDLTSGWPSN